MCYRDTPSNAGDRYLRCLPAWRCPLWGCPLCSELYSGGLTIQTLWALWRILIIFIAHSLFFFQFWIWIHITNEFEFLNVILIQVLQCFSLNVDTQLRNLKCREFLRRRQQQVSAWTSTLNYSQASPYQDSTASRAVRYYTLHILPQICVFSEAVNILWICQSPDCPDLLLYIFIIGIDSSSNTWFLEQRKAICSRRGRAAQQRVHAGAMLSRLPPTLELEWWRAELLERWSHAGTWDTAAAHTSLPQRQAGTSYN